MSLEVILRSKRSLPTTPHTSKSYVPNSRSILPRKSTLWDLKRKSTFVFETTPLRSRVLVTGFGEKDLSLLRPVCLRLTSENLEEPRVVVRPVR